MNPSDEFSELYLKQKLKEIHECLKFLLKVAHLTDSGFFDEKTDRKEMYVMINKILRNLDTAYTKGESWDKELKKVS